MYAIEINQVSKVFRNYKDKSNTLKEKLLRIRKTNHQDHWVLRDINLNIAEGETVALIGRNGSGKSTLLKLMTKILHPNKGEVIVRGRVSSLLELGAGFHPDFTGKENIYMNASILGLTKKEIDSKIDEIIRFSELEEYIDQPVRIYSSGMYMRLAFSVAISVEPEVLLIDEVLAVGDAAFQNKCIEKIKELKGKGKTIVIVTHDNGIVEKICDRAVWVHQGHIIEEGLPKPVIMKYMDELSEIENQRLIRQDSETKELPAETIASAESIPESINSNRVGNRKIEITKVEFTDDKEQHRKEFRTGSKMSIDISYSINESCNSAVFGVGIFTSDNLCCYATNTLIDDFTIGDLGQQGTVHCEIDQMLLLPGTYYVDIAVHHENGEPYDYLTHLHSFQVSSSIHDIGVARIVHHWKVERTEG